MSRSEQLAKRIEAGAAGLAAFVEGLSDSEWQTSTSATDHRTVGIIVHHVANVYPLEVEAARGIALGRDMTGVTFDVINEMNAKHASDQQHPDKSETLDLLRRNSRAAADAVRQFTDEELDQAGPFGLSFNAPVTAQFLIEDHALRHSWHHLARIRKALAGKGLAAEERT